MEVYSFLCNKFPEFAEAHNSGNLKGFKIELMANTDVTDVNKNELATANTNPVQPN